MNFRLPFLFVVCVLFSAVDASAQVAVQNVRRPVLVVSAAGSASALRPASVQLLNSGTTSRLQTLRVIRIDSANRNRIGIAQTGKRITRAYIVRVPSRTRLQQAPAVPMSQPAATPPPVAVLCPCVEAPVAPVTADVEVPAPLEGAAELEVLSPVESIEDRHFHPIPFEAPVINPNPSIDDATDDLLQIDASPSTEIQPKVIVPQLLPEPSVTDVSPLLHDRREDSVVEKVDAFSDLLNDMVE